MPILEAAPQRPIHVDARTSRDIHEQARLLDTWNQSYCQISGGQFNGSVESIWVDGVRFFIERMNRAVLQKGDVGSDRIGVGVPLRLSGRAVLCGEIAEEDDLHVFSGTSGFEYLSPEGLVFIGLEFRQPSTPKSANEGLLIRELRGKLQQSHRVIPVDKVQAQYFRSALQSLFAELAADGSLLADPESRVGLRRSSVGAVLELLIHSEEQSHNRLATIATNWQLASRARDLVEGAPDCPMSVIELALRLGVSRRTIQYACQNALGIKPMSYLRSVRLSGVRKELRHARSVSEAATRWGFWHFGRFARDYHAMFGELPSETLKHENRVQLDAK
jgi:AraC family ethanolamine operon transcriptional activator